MAICIFLVGVGFVVGWLRFLAATLNGLFSFCVFSLASSLVFD
jgi:hypothetical protein